ncbi:hypothetical protein [Vibrio natriegens]|uniref:hypothetical protein n=1 Tax=Vibrio natriegens TaxID=691 RepID=UPI000A9AC2B2|nr:hypothetical protein [Vibrio natriegens]
MIWHIKELKDDVATLFGQEQASVLSASLDSIFENYDFARYHYSEVKRLIKHHMKGKEHPCEYLKLILTNDNEVRNSELEFKLAYRANVFALLKSLHSISDFIAHVVYYAFGLNLDESTFIELDKLNLYQVKSRLKKRQEHCQVLESLEQLTNHCDYKYLKDLVNNTKHRSNILSKFTYDLNQCGEHIYQISFKPFGIHGEVSVNDYLNREYERENSLIIELGKKLNQSVSCMLTNASTGTANV